MKKFYQVTFSCKIQFYFKKLTFHLPYAPFLMNYICQYLQLKCQSSVQSLQIQTILKFKAPIPNISPLNAIHFSPSLRNDLTRYLDLSKEAVQLLVSRLKEKNYWSKKSTFIRIGIAKNNLFTLL